MCKLKKIFINYVLISFVFALQGCAGANFHPSADYRSKQVTRSNQVPHASSQQPKTLSHAQDGSENDHSTAFDVGLGLGAVVGLVALGAVLITAMIQGLASDVAVHSAH